MSRDDIVKMGGENNVHGKDTALEERGELRVFLSRLKKILPSMVANSSLGNLLEI